MKISIIIPVYNVQSYITECLESVVQQTFDGKMECLIVDDCGTDDSIAVAREFIQSHQGNVVFKIIHHDHNRGLSAARNTGVVAATGDYVFFLDSDDAIIPETIELMASVVREHPQVEMVLGGIMTIKGEPTDDFTKRQLPEYTDNVEWISNNMFFNLPVPSWNRLLKRDFLQKENITFHEGIIHEDVPYNYMLAMKCRHIGFVKKNTYLFRPQRTGSITTTHQEERALQSRLIIMNDCIDACCSCQEYHSKTRNLALRAIWRKWLTYMVILSKNALESHKQEILDISKRLSTITPWYIRPLSNFYTFLPLRLKHNRLFLKISSLC